MRSFQIFLASSINEFKTHRNEVGDFIRKVQDILIDYDIRIRLFECEFHDNSIGIGRKQDEYNEEIKKSQIFLMLVGKKLGGYTLEEYQTAVEHKVPNIYVLFHDVEYDESVKTFKNSMNENVKSFQFKTIAEMNFYIGKMIEEELRDSIDIVAQEESLCINHEFVKY